MQKRRSFAISLPPELHHSWALFDRVRHLDLGLVHRDGIRPPAGSLTDAALTELELEQRSIGRWQCDLADDSLTWSSTVYDIFEIPRGAVASRLDAVACYREESRAAMERLRTHADDIVIGLHGYKCIF